MSDTRVTYISRTRFTNSTCPETVRTGPGDYDHGPCGQGVYVRQVSASVFVRMDTPYCQRHCEIFSAWRARDLESSMGN